jgi:peroxidase
LSWALGQVGRPGVDQAIKASVVLPHINFTLDQLNAFFSGLGFNQNEMVALLGAHTLGLYGLVCTTFSYYVRSDSNTG